MLAILVVDKSVEKSTDQVFILRRIQAELHSTVMNADLLRQRKLYEAHVCSRILTDQSTVCVCMC